MRCLFYLQVVVFILLFHKVNSQSVEYLFNGVDLKGWYAFEPESGKHINALEVFSVKEGMIRLSGRKAGYLMSDKSYRNFKLKIDFRWNTDTLFIRKNNSMNSGVMYLVPFEIADTLWPQGIQFQIKKGATGDFILLQNVTLEVKGNRTTPGKSVVSNRFADAENPIGQWNTLIITSENGHIQQELNGKLVNEGFNPSVTEGRILLQYEGFPIDFKNIEITEQKE